MAVTVDKDGSDLLVFGLDVDRLKRTTLPDLCLSEVQTTGVLPDSGRTVWISYVPVNGGLRVEMMTDGGEGVKEALYGLHGPFINDLNAYPLEGCTPVDENVVSNAVSCSLLIPNARLTHNGLARLIETHTKKGVLGKVEIPFAKYAGVV